MKEKTTNYEEKELRAPSGWAVLFLTIILYLAAIGLLIFCAVNIDEYSFSGYDAGMIVCIIWLCIGWVPFIGLRVIKPNESAGADPVRKVHRHAQARGILFREHFQRSCGS